MILENNNSIIQTTGEIKEYKTSIDSKNLEHIITLLSSNLYSNPENSFLRETVSNAWDSQVEAGTTDTPIIIKFSEKDNSVTIRDFGTGISKERFETIYCKIGSSTKRESNDYIGAFGIGRFSPLSCTNTVFITSYYNGIMYSYIMIKEGNKITINLFNTCNTTEKNGVEVSIKNLPSLRKYRQALSNLIFFPNIYVKDIDNIDCDFNSYNIKKGKHYAVATTLIDNKILLGNVLYPLNKEALNLEDDNSVKFLKVIQYSGIVLTFDIGQLEITPNRENIIYSEKSKKAIQLKIKQAIDELESIIDNNLTMLKPNIFKVSTVFDFYNFNTKKLFLNLIDNKITIGSNYKQGHILYRSIYDRQFYLKCNDSKATINYLPWNAKYQNIVSRILFDIKMCGVKKIVKDGKLNSYYNNYSGFKTNTIAVKGVSNYSNKTYQYILNKYQGDYVIVKYSSFEEFYSYYLEHFIYIKNYDVTQEESINRQEWFKVFITELYFYYRATVKIIDNKSEDFINFKKSFNNSPKIKEEIILRNIQHYNDKITFSCLENCIDYIKKIHKPVILQEYKDNENYKTLLNNISDVFIFKVTKSIKKILEKQNIKNIISLETLITKNKTLKSIYTIYNTCHTLGKLDIITSSTFYYFLSTISMENSMDILNYFNKLNIMLGDSFTMFYIKHNLIVKEDEDLKAQVIKIISMYNDFLFFYKVVHPIISVQSITLNMTNYLVMKHKKYRINKNTYQECCNNKLIKLL